MRVARLLVLGKQGRQADRSTDGRAGGQAVKSSHNIKKTRKKNRDEVKKVQIEGLGNRRRKLASHMAKVWCVKHHSGKLKFLRNCASIGAL